MLRPRTNHTARKSLRIESLEDRRLLAGLVSWWTADNTAADAVGPNHGSLISGATYAPGQIGQAFRFDGINDRVQVADSASLKLTQSLTIEAWVRVDALPGGPILFRGDDRGGLDPYQLSVTSAGAMFFGISQSNNQGMSIAAQAPLGQFFHVAATLDDATGQMRLYFNGVLQAQGQTSVRPFGDLDPGSNPSIGIGNHGGWPSTPHNFPFRGLIDDLKLYDIALSEAEVLANFNATKDALGPSITIGDASNIEGDRPFTHLGNFADNSVGLYGPYHMIYGPDGHVYVSTLGGNSVLRYDAMSGAPLPAPGKTGAEFVSPNAGLAVARSLAFGPDGDLYVVSENSDAVLRFDGATGEPLGALVASGSGGLNQPRGLLFHTDGYLYVTSVGDTAGPGQDSILRYNAATGAPAGLSGQPGDAVFVTSGSGGLDNPSKVEFHNGSFYVASTSPSTSNSVLKYGTDGRFLGAFVSTGSGGLAGPSDMAFRGGFLYVVSWTNNKVLRYDGTTGAFVDELVSGNGLAAPLGLLFEPNGNLLVTSRDTTEIRRYGESADAAFSVRLNAPFPTAVSVSYATADGSAAAFSDYSPVSGTVTFAPGQWQKTIRVPIVDDGLLEPIETFIINLSNPMGGAIGDGHGVGSIIDNDAPPTKFYVVDDGSQNRTFEYTAAGALVESYGITSGNSAPRGAASSVAGDKVWVVDANRNVYVYNTSGSLVGSWTARTLLSNATPEGIGTNGTDVWIVDAKNDRMYRYAGAASRTSGSQFAASSFPLNSSNTSPKDIVTDGQHLWVVNDSSTDRVFKYTIGGSLVGSWTIDSANKNPTGLTLDPANPQHIWIVDSGTDRVYQYTSAASRTSGSQTAATSFALAAGNTNPQGIADPPSAGDEPASAASSVAVNFPSSSTSMPRRDYTPIRRLLHSAITNAPTSDELNLLARSNVAANRAIVDGDRWGSPITSAEAAVLDAALEGIDYSTWPELLADV